MLLVTIQLTANGSRKKKLVSEDVAKRAELVAVAARFNWVCLHAIGCARVHRKSRVRCHSRNDCAPENFQAARAPLRVKKTRQTKSFSLSRKKKWVPGFRNKRCAIENLQHYG